MIIIRELLSLRLTQVFRWLLPGCEQLIVMCGGRAQPSTSNIQVKLQKVNMTPFCE